MVFIQVRIMDIAIASTADDFPAYDRPLASAVINRIKKQYTSDAFDAMSRFSRGSVLIQSSRILTKDMMEFVLRQDP